MYLVYFDISALVLGWNEVSLVIVVDEIFLYIEVQTWHGVLLVHMYMFVKR